jgi:2-polyprenyl-3-methyl-5-hydroxy-6-metoxy-1,4-benzoquinol methylase
MPKRPIYESAIHHLLLHAKEVADKERVFEPGSYQGWERFIESWEFSYIDTDTISIQWSFPKKGSIKISLRNITYYYRGDTEDSRNMQEKNHQVFSEDKIKAKNDKAYLKIIDSIAKKAGMKIHTKRSPSHQAIAKIHDEEELSDHWAVSIDPKTIDVVKTNTACTSPELRFIHKTLGDITGKTILDIGCGLGEVSVYFAMHGAKVTAVDLSLPMLHVVNDLAKLNKTSVTTVQASAEELTLPGKDRFDIVYVGNVFHHVDIEKTLAHVLRLLKPDGTLILWEPVHYNPLINVYRRIATKVRSRDERPFTMDDIGQFKDRFETVKTRWFWFSTLSIFLIMAFIEFRNPNNERYWKAVIAEEKKWKPIYLPLEALDRLLLSLFPFLGPLCWNVSLVCKNPKRNIKKK